MNNKKKECTVKGFGYIPSFLFIVRRFAEVYDIYSYTYKYKCAYCVYSGGLTALLKENCGKDNSYNRIHKAVYCNFGYRIVL